jgi:hypothetical protein
MYVICVKSNLTYTTYFGTSHRGEINHCFILLSKMHMHSKMMTVSCKKKSLYNQPKPYFFKKLLWNHFWIDFNKCYTKTFGIVNILIVYLLINVVVSEHILNQNIQNCLYFVCVFAHYVYMSGFYLYIILPWLCDRTTQVKWCLVS